MKNKLQEETKRIKTLMNLTEDRKHEYSCVMLFFDFPEMNEIHASIDEGDVYTDPDDPSYGLEKDPHITLLFGLHDNVTTEMVRKVIDNIQFEDCIIFNPSLFKNEEFDVLKFDVSGGNLHECNKKLSEYPHTTDFPDYHPHLTIGYIKEGKGKEYTEKLKDMKYKLTPKHVVYSKPNGKKDIIDIK